MQKNIFLSFFFSLLGAFLLVGLCENKCVAQAYGSQPNIIYAEVEALTETEIVSNGYRSVNGLSGLQAGDAIVSVMLQNNSGYTTLGISTYMSNSYFEPYLTAGNMYPVAYILGSAAPNFLVSINYNEIQDRVGLTVMNSSPSSSDGAILYFFLKKKQNAPSSALFPTISTNVSHVINNKQYMSYTEVNPHDQTPNILLEYLIGDIDGDGVITAYDASVLNTVISSTSVTLTAANAEAYFVASHSASGTYIDGMYEQNVFIFDVADVNQDGVLTTTDADQILDYFTSVMISLDPDNPDIGTIGYYVA